MVDVRGSSTSLVWTDLRGPLAHNLNRTTCSGHGLGRKSACGVKRLLRVALWICNHTVWNGTKPLAVSANAEDVFLGQNKSKFYIQAARPGYCMVHWNLFLFLHLFCVRHFLLCVFQFTGCSSLGIPWSLWGEMCGRHVSTFPALGVSLWENTQPSLALAGHENRGLPGLLA